MNENIVHHVRGRPAGAQETLPRRTLTCWMLANGKYSAWFRTPNGGGTAIVMLSDGTITGDDSFFSTPDLMNTTAICSPVPSEPGGFAIGIDEVVLKLEGRCRGEMAVCAGAAEQALGVGVEVTLIPCRDDPSPKAELVH
jgi:hypothetical protein